MRSLLLALPLLALTTIFAPLDLQSATAQTTIEVLAQDAQNNFPEGITFSISLTSTQPIEEVRLVYSIAPDGVTASALPECTGEVGRNCTFELRTGRRILLIPGLEITYHWEVKAADGQKLDTEPLLLVYEDTRFDWRSLSEGNLTVWWYAGDQERAEAVLEAGRESLDDIGDLLNTSVDFPVKVFLYATADEMKEAIGSQPGGGVVTLGEVVYSDTAMVSADFIPLDITRHEVAHIVIREATKGPFDIPIWLNEGTAVYAQRSPTQNQSRALDSAISHNQVFSIRSLSSSSLGGTAGNVSLFYAQSWSLVSYLIEKFGQEKFAQLFAVFKEGSTPSKAFQTVYGFDLDGLESRWRQWVGLPPREMPPTPEPTGTSPPPSPTPPDGDAQPDESDDTLHIIALAVAAIVTLIVAGLIVVGGIALSRRLR